MNPRWHSRVPHVLLTVTVLALLCAGTPRLAGQNAPVSLVVLSREGRRLMQVATIGGQDMVALDDLASTFQLTVRDDGGALTVAYKGRNIVLTPDQTMASVSGRLISLTASPTRVGNRWMVPLDFISRALLPIYDGRLELRRAAHLLIVGDLRVPRVTMSAEPVGNGARLTIESTPRANSTIEQDGAQRLNVKFDADALDVALPAAQVPGFIQATRLVDPATIVIDLGPRFNAFRTATQVVDTSMRLTIDLLSGQPDSTPPATTEAPPALPPGLPELGVGSDLAIRTVAIDPGHGGDDAGVKGAKGTTEKTVTLSIAQRLKTAIEARLGLHVVMTRDVDRTVAITDRAAMANNNKADLFISLHVNASFRPSVAGTAVYVAAFDEGALGPKSQPERLPAFGGGFRDIELVPWNLAQISHRERSEAFANVMVEEFRDRVALAVKPLDRAPLRILESANMPAVLVEVGYLSNPAQETLIASSEFQNAIAQGILGAIVKFREASAAAEGPQ